MAFEYEDVRFLLATFREGFPRREHLLVLGDAIFHVQPKHYVALARKMGVTLASQPQSLDPFTFGASLGFQTTLTLDVNGRASLNLDLCAPPAEEQVQRFDCVIDAGVLFWCFDPAAALRSILTMTRPGGLIAHITAVSGHYGRGYYNIHPLALEDFYLANGCQFLGASFRTKYQLPRLLAGLLRRLGFGNKVTFAFEPGSAYLNVSRFNRISFADHPREPAESNMIPNNATGVLLYRKVQTSDSVAFPVRSVLYGPEEAARRREANEGFSAPRPPLAELLR
ncbi:MAG TPA: hypothetical protein VK009_01265 [Chloroflexota bacterium]|nr:hypothetical protein [Chloroflexota bacterium]